MMLTDDMRAYLRDQHERQKRVLLKEVLLNFRARYELDTLSTGRLVGQWVNEQWPERGEK